MLVDEGIFLTNNEVQVLKLMSKGLNNNEIAKEMIISVHTVKSYVCSIFSKFKVTSCVQAVIHALKLKIIL